MDNERWIFCPFCGAKTRPAFAGYRLAEFPAFLPQMQAGKHHQRAKLSNPTSARRLDAVLTAP